MVLWLGLLNWRALRGRSQLTSSKSNELKKLLASYIFSSLYGKEDTILARQILTKRKAAKIDEKCMVE